MAVTLDDRRGSRLGRPFPACHRGFRQLQRIAACRNGSTALEFALSLPILLLLLVGMIEVSMVMFVSTSVEGGLREAARYGITGQTPEDGTREEAIIDILETYTFGFVKIDPADVTFTTYASFNDVEQPEPWTDSDLSGAYDLGEPYDDLNGNLQWDDDRGTAGVGVSGDVVLYEIDYDWELMTPFLAHLLGDAGVFHMTASIAVRNEPYEFGGS